MLLDLVKSVQIQVVLCLWWRLLESVVVAIISLSFRTITRSCPVPVNRNSRKYFFQILLAIISGRIQFYNLLIISSWYCRFIILSLRWYEACLQPLMRFAHSPSKSHFGNRKPLLGSLTHSRWTSACHSTPGCAVDRSKINWWIIDQLIDINWLPSEVLNTMKDAWLLCFVYILYLLLLSS